MNFSYRFKISNLIFLKRDLANFKIFEFFSKSPSVSERKLNKDGTYISLGLASEPGSKRRLGRGVNGSKASLVQDPDTGVGRRVCARRASPFKSLVESLLRCRPQVQLLHWCWLAWHLRCTLLPREVELVVLHEGWVHFLLARRAVFASTVLMSDAHLLVWPILVDFWLLQEVLSQHMLHNHWLHLGMLCYWLSFIHFFGCLFRYSIYFKFKFNYIYNLSIFQ